MINREPFNFLRQHRQYILFCLFYFLGLIAGALYIYRYPFYSLMRLSVYSQMSIVVGVVVTALPFIVYYIIFRCLSFYWILPVAFLRAFAFMYCFGGTTLAYADAGWLMRCLLMFSDCLSVPLLLWFAVRGLLRGFAISERCLGICLLCICAIKCVDSYVVSPFAMRLSMALRRASASSR